MIITGTYNLKVDLSWSLQQLEALYLECDTTNGPVTINLFEIQDLQGYKNVKLYISDIGNNATINNIVINTFGSDEINTTGQTAFSITANGSCAILSIMTETKWAAFTQSLVGNTGLTFKGSWDANSNTPTLTSGVGTNGYYYIVSIAGNTNLDGVTDWQVGDWAIFEGATNMWQKIDNHDVQAYNTVQDEGNPLPQRSIVDFQGEVNATDNGLKTIVNIPLQQAYDTIQDEGNPLPQRRTIDFQGPGVSVSDNGVKTIVNVNLGTPTLNYGLFTQTAQGLQITNTNIELPLIGAGLGSLSVPQNTFVPGDSYHAIMTGHLNSANNQGLQIRIKSNGLVLADTGIVTLNTATNRHFKLEVYFTVRTIGGSGVASIVTGGTFMYTKNASITFEGSDFSTETIVGFDTTVINNLVITAQWSAANPNNTIYSELFTLNKTF